MKRDDLYFMLNPALGIIKIGIAGDVEARRVTLEHGCGVPLDVMRVATGAGEFEKDLHAVFAAARLCGEWFEPTPELLDLATGSQSIRAFVELHEDAIRAGVALREQRRLERQAEQREAARADLEEAEQLKAEEARIRAARAEKTKKAREAAERKRREREATERAAQKAVAQELAARQMKLPMSEAVRVAAGRREAIAQRARNTNLLGIRRAAVIPAIDLKHGASHAQ